MSIAECLVPERDLGWDTQICGQDTQGSDSKEEQGLEAELVPHLLGSANI